MSDQEHEIPDFDLAKEVAYPPEAIVPLSGDAPLARFNLALALVFNDLKDFLWLNSQLVKAEAVVPSQVPTAARGQVNGMRLHVARRWIGLVHELLELLKHNLDLLETPGFRAQLDQLPRPYQRKWNSIVGLARETPGGRSENAKFRKELDRLRNKVANHYGDTRTLASGYRYFFGRGKQGPFAQRAYVSSGRNAEATRFYFADAAANGAIYRETGTSGSDYVNRVGEVIVDINAVLKSLIDAYLADKAPDDETA